MTKIAQKPNEASESSPTISAKAFIDDEKEVFRDHWHLHPCLGGNIGINAVEAWQALGYLKDKAGDHIGDVKVAIIDSGVDVDHPSLKDGSTTKGKCLVARSYDVFANERQQNASQGPQRPLSSRLDHVLSDQATRIRPKEAVCNKHDPHGTALAGIVAARPTKGGVIGVAPYSKIVPIRANAAFDPETLIHAIEFAASEADVILLTRTLPYTKELEETVVRVASQVPVICAAGNNGTRGLVFPASLPQTIGVGACNNKGYRSTYSQYGDGLDVVAPSNDVPMFTRDIERQEDDERLGDRAIETTDNRAPNGYNADSDYCRADHGFPFGGTSAAAAQVAGVVALMLSVAPGVPSAQIKSCLRETARDDVLRRDGNRNGEFGFGLVDAGKAVANVVSGTSQPVAAPRKSTP